MELGKGDIWGRHC